MSLGLKLLRQLSPETSHRLALKALDWSPRWVWPTLADMPVQVMGLNFPNPIGVAAGLDKNGDYIDALAKLGFGFIEIGTVTPKAQAGNPQPRLFRLPEAQGIINRMGFDNHGVDYLIRNVQASRYKGILGINIGKNRDTPLEQAIDDYMYCYDKVYPYASYIVINISSPNTPGLRDLQHGEFFTQLLSTLKARQNQFSQQFARYVPLVIKISPDNAPQELQEMVVQCLQHEVDAITATNTTQDHETVKDLPHANEQGGLSGAPLTEQSLAVLRQINQLIDNKLPIISVGGIMSAEQAQVRFANGASLVQVYSGLVYQGPRLLQAISRAIFPD